MDFLEDHNVTCIQRLNIVVYEREKAKEFQEEWENLFKGKYGDDDSEEEQKADEDSDEDEEPVFFQKSKSKKKSKYPRFTF